MKLTAKEMQLYFVMGSQDCGSRPPVDVLRQAIRGGITCFQFREKNSGLTMAETMALGRRLHDECRKHHVPFIVNDRVDVALLLEADGVHVGQEDLPVREVKKLIGADMQIGVSVQTVEEAERAIANGADYLGTGPMAVTASKQDAKRPIGTQGLSALSGKLRRKVPLVAIGGINKENAFEIVSAGADGIAVISAIARQQDPERAATELRKTVQKSLEVSRGDG